MRLFLQVNIGSWQTQRYEKPWLSFASSQADDIIGTDLDSESDPYITDLVTKLIQQANLVFILIQAEEANKLGGVNVLFQKLLRSQEKIAEVILVGEHTHVKKLFGSLEEKFIMENDEEAIKSRIANFARTAL